MDHRAAALALLTSPALLLGLTSAPPAHAAVGQVGTPGLAQVVYTPSLTVTPGVAMIGEATELTGAIPPGIARPVTLERVVGTTTTELAHSTTTSTGGFRLTTSAPFAPGERITYRVTAPAVTVAGRSYAATSVTRTQTVVSQQLTASAPVAVDDQTPTVTVTAVPARPGRPVTFQQLTGTGWSTLSTVTQDSAGTARVRLSSSRLPSGRSLPIRAVAAAYAGAASITSSPVGASRVTQAGGVSSLVAPDGGHSHLWDVSDDGGLVSLTATNPLLPPWQTTSGGYLVRTSTGAARLLPGTVTGPAALTGDGSTVAYGWTSPTMPSRLRVWDSVTGSSRTVTSAPAVNEPFTVADVADGSSHAVLFTRTGSTGLWLMAPGGPARQVSPTATAAGLDVSADGGSVLYTTLEADSTRTLWRWSAASGVSTRVAGRVVANREGSDMTPDGRQVAFVAQDPALAGGTGSGQPEAFVLDTTSGALTRVARTTGTSRVTGVSISSNGTRLAWTAQTGDLGDTFLLTRTAGGSWSTGTTQRLTAGPGTHEWQGNPQLSGDGRRVTFETVYNADYDCVGDAQACDPAQVFPHYVRQWRP